ncbi:hypothetical protein CC78DRAFT_43386 [Lojkania enalia]|uniref:Nucleoporin NUP37 n=1 Tax=Lojkania enalia TaxID=147567 RepID=A0A9P4MWB0_9PLEO|nr:hypothetical protein CC78DRAFT_43386 [Didymosphaeria enalia]
MKPLISTQGKFTQLRYELPTRVHDAKVYPVKAPNGSTVILYAYESGVGIVWRGGRPLKQAAPPPKQPVKPPKVNGTSSEAIMIIDSDDEEPPAPPALPVPQPPLEAEFEDEEEELDPDQPYPSIIQNACLSLNTEVVHIAVPEIPAASAIQPIESVPPVFSKKIVFTVACADCSVRIITMPLSPPSPASEAAPLSEKSQLGEEVLKIPTHAGHQSIPRGVTMTWTSSTEPTPEQEAENEMEIDAADDRDTAEGQGKIRPSEGWDLLVASHSAELGGVLKIWRFNLNDTSVQVTSPITAYRTLMLRNPATRIAFSSALYPSRRHSQLLITNRTGIARIYDPFARSTHIRRRTLELGAFVRVFRSTFEQPTSDIPLPAVLAARKPILDAAWASNGHAILALLADGEWGIWDVDRTGPSPPSDPSSFSVRGFVGTQDHTRLGRPTSEKPRNSRDSLTPMTPNTRRSKEESLFKGVSERFPMPHRGGVSIASLRPATGGSPEDTAIIWYAGEAYRAPNLHQLWERTTAAKSQNAIFTPALFKVQGLNLFGEAIMAIDQFDTTTREARMAIPRDVLVCGERRLIITTATTEPLGRDLNAVFEKERAEEEETRKIDQALLARRELDLGGMDRLLNSMETSGGVSGQHSLVLGNPRKVLFASSTS